MDKAHLTKTSKMPSISSATSMIAVSTNVATTPLCVIALQNMLKKPFKNSTELKHSEELFLSSTLSRKTVMKATTIPDQIAIIMAIAIEATTTETVTIEEVTVEIMVGKEVEIMVEEKDLTMEGEAIIEIVTMEEVVMVPETITEEVMIIRLVVVAIKMMTDLTVVEDTKTIVTEAVKEIDTEMIDRTIEMMETEIATPDSASIVKKQDISPGSVKSPEEGKEIAMEGTEVAAEVRTGSRTKQILLDTVEVEVHIVWRARMHVLRRIKRRTVLLLAADRDPVIVAQEILPEVTQIRDLQRMNEKMGA